MEQRPAGQVHQKPGGILPFRSQLGYEDIDTLDWKTARALEAGLRVPLMENTAVGCVSVPRQTPAAFACLRPVTKNEGSIINVGVLWTLLFTRPLVLR